MAAAQAVFNTNELLEMIIVFLPAPQINMVRNVARRWATIIKESSNVQKVRCQRATFREDDDKAEYIAAGASETPRTSHVLCAGHIPIYYVEYDVQVNDHMELINQWRGRRRAPVRSIIHRYFLSTFRLMEEDCEQLKQFATNPPVHKLALNTEFVRQPSKHTPSTCVVRNDAGVTLKDLWHAMHAMHETYETFLPSQDVQRIVVEFETDVAWDTKLPATRWRAMSWYQYSPPFWLDH